MFERCQSRGLRSGSGLCALLLLAVCAGCGTATYEWRLDQTRRYYEYISSGNRLLSQDEWSGQGIELRPPQGFDLMEAPEGLDAAAPDAADAASAETNRDEEGFEERVFIDTPEIPREGSESTNTTPSLASTAPPAIRDPRQPDFIDYDMPGLMAAWQAEFEGTNGPRRAYMYLLSNHKRWLDQGSPTGGLEPERFLEDFKNSFDYALRTEPTIEIEEPDRYEERLPKGQGYVPVKKVERFRYPATVKGAPTEIMLYCYEQDGIQVALVFVLPGGPDQVRELHDAMVYTVEWMKVSGEKPTAARRGGVPSSGF